MKYTVSIEIDLPRERVVQLLADSAHVPKWVRGVVLHGPDTTLWVSENEYRFSGLPRLLAPFMGGVFRKQSQQHMQDFKAFAEQGTDVREAKD